MSGDGKETDHQPKHAVDRILGEDNHQRGANGKCCKNEEGDRYHGVVSGAKIAEIYEDELGMIIDPDVCLRQYVWKARLLLPSGLFPK